MVMQTELTFMTFNVRYATVADGKNAWSERRDLAYWVIDKHEPDVLGVQEALAVQVDELSAHLKEYGVVGVGRDDGKTAGEYSAIFFRRDEFELVDSGTFWLSETPDVPGSKSWGNNVVRICTWAKLRHSSGKLLTVFNTHFDHESAPSRLSSAALVLERMPPDAVLMGDFNAGESSPEVRALLAGGLRDTYRLIDPHAKAVGTFNGFDAKATTGEKIDYVFAGSHWRVVDADIERSTREGRCPSDHFPVWARLAWVGP